MAKTEKGHGNGVIVVFQENATSDWSFSCDGWSQASIKQAAEPFRDADTEINCINGLKMW